MIVGAAEENEEVNKHMLDCQKIERYEHILRMCKSKETKIFTVLLPKLEKLILSLPADSQDRKDAEELCFGYKKYGSWFLGHTKNCFRSNVGPHNKLEELILQGQFSEAFAMIYKKDVDLNSNNGNGLKRAMLSLNIPAMHFFFRHHADLYLEDCNGLTPLRVALAGVEFGRQTIEDEIVKRNKRIKKEAEEIRAYFQNRFDCSPAITNIILEMRERNSDK